MFVVENLRLCGRVVVWKNKDGDDRDDDGDDDGGDGGDDGGDDGDDVGGDDLQAADIQ